MLIICIDTHLNMKKKRILTNKKQQQQQKIINENFNSSL